MILFIISAVLIVLGLLALSVSMIDFDRGCSTGLIICGVAIGLIGLALRAEDSEAEQTETPVPIEYPASEYRLQLRIVEFEGQRDTTYVLVEKIKEYERCQ